jgi:hypothetical protein
MEQVLQELRQIKNIERFRVKLGGEYVSDLLANLSEPSSIVTLDLAKSHLGDQDLEQFSRFENLRKLYLGGTRVTDAGLRYLSPLANLTKLYLDHTTISAIGLRHLHDLPALEVLDLTWTAVDDSGLPILEGMISLKELDLRGAQVTAAGYQALVQHRPDVAISWVPTIRVIGYWSAEVLNPQHKTEASLQYQACEETGLIHPKCLVDPTWAEEDRSNIVEYLSSARDALFFGGPSFCRFGCGLNGCTEKSDGVWMWPEGLAHYVRFHNVRLPDEFLTHMRSRAFSPSCDKARFGNNDFCRSLSYWRTWCSAQKTSL